MADAKELRGYATFLRNTKPNAYDDWRNMCLGAADLLIRQASVLEATTKQKAELIEELDQNKKTIAELIKTGLSHKSEIERMEQEVAVAKHWLAVEKRKNKK